MSFVVTQQPPASGGGPPAAFELLFARRHAAADGDDAADVDSVTDYDPLNEYFGVIVHTPASFPALGVPELLAVMEFSTGNDQFVVTPDGGTTRYTRGNRTANGFVRPFRSMSPDFPTIPLQFLFASVGPTQSAQISIGSDGSFFTRQYNGSANVYFFMFKRLVS